MTADRKFVGAAWRALGSRTHRVRWAAPGLAALAAALVLLSALLPLLARADSRARALPGVPTDVDIFHSGLFIEPLAPVRATHAADNRALGAALGQYREAVRQAGSADAVEPLQEFLAAHADSPWKPALELNLGIIYRQTGHFSKALEVWQGGWRDSQGLTDERGVALANNMVSRLSELEAYLGRMELLSPLLDSLEKRSVGGAASVRLTNSLTGLNDMRQHPEESFRCGPLALSRIVDYGKHESAASAHAVLDEAPSTANGLSLSMVQAIAERAGMHYQMAYRAVGAPVIIPAVTHWKVGHYAALVDKQDGRYLVQDATFGEDIRVSPATLEEEASGYFLVPEGALPEGWRVVAPEEADQVWGRGNTGTHYDMGDTGSQAVTSDNSSPFNTSSAVDSSLTNQTCATCGMTGASVELMTAGLQLKDTPVGYRAPAGPPVRVQLVYSQNDMPLAAPAFSNFGPNWEFNWLSYVAVTNGGAQATLYQRGGGTEPFTFSSTTALMAIPGPYSRAILTRNTAQTIYTLTFPDGSVEVFDKEFVNNGTTSEFLMHTLSDKVGNTITLAYDGMNRITSITDAVGQVTTFSYTNAAYPLQITQIADPFGNGRVAKFTYCPSPTTTACPTGNLASITDVLGITSSFIYGQTTGGNANFINTLTTPYGQTLFQFGINTTTGERSLQTTDPLGRVSYVDFNQAVVPADATNMVTLNGQPSYQVPSTLVPGTANTPVKTCNNYLQSRNTYVFDANQFNNAGGVNALNGGSLTYSQAHVIHWLHNPADTSPTSTARVMESEKQPLENRVWYNYAGQNPGCATNPLGARFFPVTASGTVMSGANNQPTAVARVVLGSDGMTPESQVQYFAYNSAGNVTMSQDPIGRTIKYQYDNLTGIDLLSTTNITGSLNDVLEQRSGYTNHLPQTITGTNLYSSTYLYNRFGQVTKFTDAQSETTKFTYGTGSMLASAQLMKIQGPISAATTQYTYDSVSRLASVTDSAGYEIQYTSYDNADRLLTTQYPDGTTTVQSYIDPKNGTGKQALLHLITSTDRLGQMTSYRYDSAEELTSATSAANDVTRYGYNLAGVLNSLTDPRTKVTSWILDDESRVVQKYFADSTTTFEQTAYEAAISRVTTFTDRVGQTTAYTYNLDNSRYSTTYSNDTNPTSTVYFFYDPAYPRLVQMIDQFSKKSGNTSTWTYYPVQTTQALGANQLETVTRAVPGGGTGNTEDTVTYTYDQLNRVVGTTIDGVAQSVGYDAVGRLKTSTNALDAFTYGYSPNDATARITSVTSTAGPAVAMTYNNATTIPSNELVNQITVSSGTNTLQQFGYTLYDADDNLKTGTLSIPSQSLSNSLSYNYDPANRLLNLTVNSATNPQYVYTPDASSNLTSITTNGTTKNYTYTSTNTITAGIYDANGSPTSLANYGYSWDGANRLIGSTNPSPASSSAFYYDGFGRVVLIVESNSAGTVTAKHAYLWCGNTVCLAHDDLNGGAVSTQYFPQGAIIAGTPYYYIRDRLGSVTALVANGGSVATQYTFDPYGNRTLLSGTVPADIGYAGYFAHAASGLDITMNRFFDPVHGRWLNRDPIGESGGVNLYAYAGGNPTTFTDPSGFDTYITNRFLAIWSPMPDAVPPWDFVSHTFIFSTNPDGSIAHTYSWGNTANPSGWNLDQSEDIAAAQEALAWEFATKIGEAFMDPYYNQAFNMLNNVEPTHGNGVVTNNCKTEATNLSNLATALYLNSSNGSQSF